ncbi:MAG: tyrosine-type recombinase/integrase [Burkholderiales bacterium]|nr:tyrosine-type recombinase/integrase [Burkholderiales bacterium]
MTPRRRSLSRRGWPANLYCRGGYFTWRDPRTREEIGLGRIAKEDAFRQAIEANLWLAKQLDQPRLVDRLTGNQERTVGAWGERFWQDLKARDPPLAANTLKSYKSLLGRTLQTFGERAPIRSITPLTVDAALKALAGTPRLAQAWRSFLKEFSRAAIVPGWLDENPVRDVRAGRVVVKRARLTLTVLRQVYESCETVWLRNAIALALLTGQRREDIALAQVAEFRDDAWRLTQRKTGAKLEIPLELRLDAFGMSLRDVYEQCRRTGVLSRYLIHQTAPYGNSPVGSPIWKDTVSRRFSGALAALGLDWGEKTPPTFHEIRSLAERLYGAQGNVDTQQLLGHADPETTLLYRNNRGAEFVRVTIKPR